MSLTMKGSRSTSKPIVGEIETDESLFCLDSINLELKIPVESNNKFKS